MDQLGLVFSLPRCVARGLGLLIWLRLLLQMQAPTSSLRDTGGLVETDVEHPEWCGAERATIGAAEMTAVLKALVWISALLTFVDNFLV